MHITSATNPRVKSLTTLATKKGRREQGQFLVEGLQALTFALQAGHKPHTLIHTPEESHPLLAPLQEAAGNTLTMPPHLLAKLTRSENPQTVLATFPTTTSSLEEIGKNPKAPILVLDRIRDPGNLGTIIRTADAAGLAHIVLVGDCTDAFAPETVRATMGSLFHLHLVHSTEDEFLSYLKNMPEAQIIGTHLNGKIPFFGVAENLTLKAPRFVLMGTEQAGLSEALTSACTHLTRIPMAGRLESLNLAIATALTLYEVQKPVLLSST